jgi:HK97 family phage prohead protease
MSEESSNLPRDDLFRAVYPGFELREANDGAMPRMSGHFAVFNQWTEIDSIFEGRFMERFAPGAFKKTMSDRRESLKVLFQHGHDPQVGDKPLGPIEDLREDDRGAYYEVPLLDAPYVRDNVLPGLEAGLYGASFRFRVLREEMDDKPERSAHNPDGIQERTVKEVELKEFGPVTFPAYEGATAGVRSLTDAFLRDPDQLRVLSDRLDRVMQYLEGLAPQPAPTDPDAGRKPTSEPVRRDHKPNGKGLFGTNKERGPSWLL